MLLLVRHGRTDLNAAGLLQGRIDAPLDETGRRQAAALATVAALGAASRVVCSPLLRARDTAAALGLPVTIDERWIELDYGTWDGRPFASVLADDWARWRADPGWSPPGGESLTAVGDRVQPAVAELVDEAAESDVVVVTHTSPIKAAVASALGVGDELAWSLHLDPASITRISLGSGRPVLHSLNETAHLG